MLKNSAALLCLFTAISSNAAPVVHGNLSSDTLSSIITDTSNGREYLRFDEFNFSYAETLSAVAPGGIYEGWSIADRAVVEDFIDSILGGTSICTGLGYQGICGTVNGWSDGNFGGNSQPTDDTMAFISDTGVYTFGAIAIRDDGLVSQYEAWGNVDTLDFWGQVIPAAQINLLLYRDPDLDPDGDGVLAAEDNCPGIANPDQEPSSVEPGRGIACEGLPPGC